MTKKVTIIGAGLAGSEAAWQVANAGVPVDLYEMRPVKKTPAHQTENFAELVCSNSLRGNSLTNAVGVLKEEMRRLNSIIIGSADQTAVPAGGALAVDRDSFSETITEKIKSHPLITIKNEEITDIPEGIVIIATGPLTSESLSQKIQEFNGSEGFYFYDAAAPIIDKSTIDMDKVYLKSRYNKGEAAYLNCPMTEEEFNAFHEALVNAEVVPLRTFEKEKFFEGCMPIEVMAQRGIKTMLFGPMKPVGLEDPKTGKRPYAVIQLRQDYGVMHRNSFMNSPELLKPTYQSKKRDDLFFAGQMTGVEGYVESAASGLLAGINAARLAKGEEPIEFPRETTLGSMAYYITHAEGKHFQPMNANFGLFPELPERIRDKKERYEAIANRALDVQAQVIQSLD